MATSSFYVLLGQRLDPDVQHLVVHAFPCGQSIGHDGPCDRNSSSGAICGSREELLRHYSAWGGHGGRAPLQVVPPPYARTYLSTDLICSLGSGCQVEALPPPCHAPPHTNSTPRICFEPHDEPSDPLISPCKCSGSSSFIHRHCLRKWRESALQNPR